MYRSHMIDRQQQLFIRQYDPDLPRLRDSTNLNDEEMLEHLSNSRNSEFYGITVSEILRMRPINEARRDFFFLLIRNEMDRSLLSQVGENNSSQE